ncbi:MAG TPA: hypothetical protein VK753_04090 [Xanthomonadaceae bacterium]|nr:hypothetical protein [Xanthomonadaceae bacterium]
MPRYKIAHVREQGVDLIIVPLEDAFEHRSEPEQRQTISTLQVRARSAGLAGTVVPVWNQSNGCMRFIAPPNWHAFFKSLSLPLVCSALNRELYW